MRYVTCSSVVSVSVSKNLTRMLTSSMSPMVMSEGESSVRTVTSMPSKLIGSAWSPPRPWPEAPGRAAKAAKTPTDAASSAIPLCNGPSRA